MTPHEEFYTQSPGSRTTAGQRDAAITRAADAQGECAEKSALLADCEVENVRLRKEIARITAVLESLAGMRRE